MPFYRAYPLERHSRTLGAAIEYEAADDTAAVGMALEHFWGSDVEVWEGDRCVEFPGQSAISEAIRLRRSE